MMGTSRPASDRRNVVGRTFDDEYEVRTGRKEASGAGPSTRLPGGGQAGLISEMGGGGIDGSRCW